MEEKLLVKPSIFDRASLTDLLKFKVIALDNGGQTWEISGWEKFNLFEEHDPAIDYRFQLNIYIKDQDGQTGEDVFGSALPSGSLIKDFNNIGYYGDVNRDKIKDDKIKDDKIKDDESEDDENYNVKVYNDGDNKVDSDKQDNKENYMSIDGKDIYIYKSETGTNDVNINIMPKYRCFYSVINDENTNPFICHEGAIDYNYPRYTYRSRPTFEGRHITYQSIKYNDLIYDIVLIGEKYKPNDPNDNHPFSILTKWMVYKCPMMPQKIIEERRRARKFVLDNILFCAHDIPLDLAKLILIFV